MAKEEDWKEAGEPLDTYPSPTQQEKEAAEGAAVGAAAGLGCLGFGLLPISIIVGVILVLLILGGLRGGCNG